MPWWISLKILDETNAPHIQTELVLAWSTRKLPITLSEHCNMVVQLLVRVKGSFKAWLGIYCLSSYWKESPLNDFTFSKSTKIKISRSAATQGITTLYSSSIITVVSIDLTWDYIESRRTHEGEIAFAPISYEVRNMIEYTSSESRFHLITRYTLVSFCDKLGHTDRREDASS